MAYREWDWDIDRYLNRFIPPPPWHRLPPPVARLLGYRQNKLPSTGNILPLIWAFIGITLTISIIEAATKSVPDFVANDGPIIVGSFGASAVLEFLVIESPLAQPRNAVGGHIIATITGVIISKLFQLSSNFNDIRWLGGALACATATVLMALTKTVHPPAGATALSAVVDAKLVDLGWRLVPVVMLGSTLMLGMSLLINNIDRRFPLYWWTPLDLGQTSVSRPGDAPEQFEAKLEEGSSNGNEYNVKRVSNGEIRPDAGKPVRNPPPAYPKEETQGGTGRKYPEYSLFTEAQQSYPTRSHLIHDFEVTIRPGKIFVPESDDNKLDGFYES
ncbi:hypothetical protein XA68_14168 [Ophiocordyceps unilateralis]|uniref:HPP transmembrane region domain-containing protein n=1 Tax=Ophiocordyceps unilateralis TaxID=268505 RepID=A0A2A9PLS2_OPHUN|nr:hypothetical protein XA68_14168 [Ophiocordyceps unilateralis]